MDVDIFFIVIPEEILEDILLLYENFYLMTVSAQPSDDMLKEMIVGGMAEMEEYLHRLSPTACRKIVRARNIHAWAHRI